MIDLYLSRLTHLTDREDVGRCGATTVREPSSREPHPQPVQILDPPQSWLSPNLCWRDSAKSSDLGHSGVSVQQTETKNQNQNQKQVESSGLRSRSGSRVPSVPYSHFFQNKSHFRGLARADSGYMKILISEKLEKRVWNLIRNTPTLQVTIGPRSWMIFPLICITIIWERVNLKDRHDILHWDWDLYRNKQKYGAGRDTMSGV